MNFVENYKTPEKKESVGEKLSHLMSLIAEQTKTDLVAEFGASVADLLNQDDALEMRNWSVKNNGCYSKEQIKADEKIVQDSEKLWSASDNEGVREYYKEKYGSNTTQDLLERYKKNKLNHRGTIVEMAITSILYKFLHEDFVVMRASIYDDYKNGVDNVIVNKHTGEVICAFDEVYEGYKSDRLEAKVGKVVRKAKQGGAEIKYGFTFIKDESGHPSISKQAIKNIPTFYLSLSVVELEKLLTDMSFDSVDSLSMSEAEIFNHLLDSLSEQVKMLQVEQISEKVRANIDKFAVSLKQIQAQR